MKYLLIMIMLFSASSSLMLFDFDKNSDLSNWRVVDDVVMGGRSSGHFSLNEEGHAVFEGEVSLANNGGFSSVDYNFRKIQTSDYSKVVIRLKGDGKKYQFRLKADVYEYYSYAAEFDTSGEWEEVEIDFEDMYPTYRGRNLDKPKFDGKSMTQITFLIGNKKEQNFKLLLDKIELK
ncbi:CIA30 family protein [Gramella sp. KN1008]|uniref:CIA30 family protein n=1 Tax=Gramella sp. KN1008 TaxID=2529298 RepID=UPI00103974FA|nr:CIA30 family protein [Gramella sp. KN1008]TBW30255.1 CIA30 family protein [Gramella sp. KN1008]